MLEISEEAQEKLAEYMKERNLTEPLRVLIAPG
jgi:Fe-S cluster assembly iron-binding protein IscA